MKYRQLLCGLAITAVSFNLSGHSQNDSQGTLYQGLQNLDRLAEVMGLDRNQSLGEIGKNNLVSSLLSPWNEESVNQSIAYHGDIKETAKAMVQGTFNNPLFDASGFEVDKAPFIDLIERGYFLQSYHAEARGITLDDTDALFVPTATFLTKHLAGTANTASDQKSSSTLIPANTPVYILGQLQELSDTISMDEDSWLLIWREEFGIKFVRSRHIGRLSQADIEAYRQRVTNKPEIVRTGRVQRHFLKHNFAMLMPGTMPVHDGNQYFLANRNASEGETVQVGGNTWKIYGAALTPTTLKSKDKVEKLGYHLKQAPITATVASYLDELHNAMFYYPAYAGPNINRDFAWGEGITGIDNRHGQDISNFVYKLMLGFGYRLPRYSADQISAGIKINSIKVDKSQSKESHHKTMVEHCTLGRMASFAATAHMVCLGSVSMTQLEALDPQAAADALNSGMSADDKIPLVASSPVGLRDVATGSWSILPKAAVIPLFKTGPFSSWVSRKTPLQIFSFFKNSPKLTARSEL